MGKGSVEDVTLIKQIPKILVKVVQFLHYFVKVSQRERRASEFKQPIVCGAAKRQLGLKPPKFGSFNSLTQFYDGPL